MLSSNAPLGFHQSHLASFSRRALALDSLLLPLLSPSPPGTHLTSSDGAFPSISGSGGGRGVGGTPRVAARTLPPAGEGRPCTGATQRVPCRLREDENPAASRNRAQLRGLRRPWKRKVLPLSYLSRSSRLWMWKRTVRNNRCVEAAQRQAMPLFRGERLSVCVRLRRRLGCLALGERSGYFGLSLFLK